MVHQAFRSVRRLLILAAVLSALCVGGYACYRWQLPAPVPIVGEPVQTTQEHTYTNAAVPDDPVLPEEVVTETGFTDQDFLTKAQEVLTVLGTQVDAP